MCVKMCLLMVCVLLLLFDSKEPWRSCKVTLQQSTCATESIRIISHNTKPSADKRRARALIVSSVRVDLHLGSPTLDRLPLRCPPLLRLSENLRNSKNSFDCVKSCWIVAYVYVFQQKVYRKQKEVKQQIQV